MKRNLETFINFMDGLLDAYVVLGLIVLLMIGIYISIDNLYVYFNASNSYQGYRPWKTEDEQEPLKIEGNVAWIKIDDTTIDYPIMQGDNNSIYLNTDPLGNYSMSGSIFLDYRNASDFSDGYSLVYGHHMNYGVMFGALDDYRKESYFHNHMNGAIAINGKKYDLHVFAAMTANADSGIWFDPKEKSYDEMVKKIEEEASYSVPPGGDRIVALSTCVAADSKERFIVFCWFDSEKGEDIDTEQ